MKLLLTISYLLCLVNAKLASKITEEENAAKEVRVITTPKEEERFRNSEYCKFTIRNPRYSEEHAAKSNMTQDRTTEKLKVALVKKPIPKFMDTGSEEDYQVKIPNKISASVEHEDEDFSVDDYDFDVNHDEFSGRGKPLEPRVKVKVSRLLKPAPAKIEMPRSVATLSQSKVKISHDAIRPSIKVARKAPDDKMKEEEYDEEFSPITKSPEKQRKTIKVTDTSSVSEENEDSKEEEFKRPIRITRSSPFSFGTYVDKLGERTRFMSKMLSYLPLFPQRYSPSQEVNKDVIAPNAPMLDPWLGRAIVD